MEIFAATSLIPQNALHLTSDMKSSHVLMEDQSLLFPHFTHDLIFRSRYSQSFVIQLIELELRSSMANL
jgi:hypothetical protein